MAAESEDIQYVQLEGSAFDAAKEFIENTGRAKLNIMFIEKVISKKQTASYDACELGNERYMFHGTNPDNCSSIEAEGLQVKFAVRSAYGKGNYFSPDPLVSLSYASFKYDYYPIYLCSVKLGEFGINHNSNYPLNNIYVAFTDAQSNTLYRIGLYSHGHSK